MAYLFFNNYARGGKCIVDLLVRNRAVAFLRMTSGSNASSFLLATHLHVVNTTNIQCPIEITGESVAKSALLLRTARRLLKSAKDPP